MAEPKFLGNTFKPLTKESYDVLAQFATPNTIGNAVNNLRTTDGRIRPIVKRLQNKQYLETIGKAIVLGSNYKSTLYKLTLSGEHVVTSQKREGLGTKSYGNMHTEDGWVSRPLNAGWVYKKPNDYLEGASVDV